MIENYAPIEKASNAVARRLEKLREKMTVLPGTPGGADVHVASEIRAFIRAQESPEQFAYGLRTDPKVVQAVLGAPSFLSGMSDEAAGRLRAVALETCHPEEVREVEELTAAEKIARDALALARHPVTRCQHVPRVELRLRRLDDLPGRSVVALLIVLRHLNRARRQPATASAREPPEIPDGVRQPPPMPLA